MPPQPPRQLSLPARSSKRFLGVARVDAEPYRLAGLSEVRPDVTGLEVPHEEERRIHEVTSDR